MLKVGTHVRALLAVTVIGTLGGNAALLLQPAATSVPELALAPTTTAVAPTSTTTTSTPPVTEAPVVVPVVATVPHAPAPDDDGPGVRNRPDRAPRPKPAPASGPIVGLLDGPDIEGYARYEGQSTCDPTPKPGTLAIRNLLLARYPGTTSLGISRNCDVGGRSEHKEGRAFDWGANVTDVEQRAAVEDFLQFLFATDSYGHKHALARRMGVMYVIWNAQIWSASNADAGWQPYSGESAHTDHVHISLSWAGARAETSYYSGKVVPGLPDGTQPAGGLARTGMVRPVRTPDNPTTTTTPRQRWDRTPDGNPPSWDGGPADGEHHWRDGDGWRPPTTTTTAPPATTTTASAGAGG